MDEVDKIIISSLNMLGCDLESEITSLSQFGLQEVVVGVVYCLHVVSAERCGQLSHKLPQNMAQRFRAAALIAQEVKSLGYHGDLGYQSLLYPNEVDIRRLFSFLLEKLPKDSADLNAEPLSGAGLLLASARKQLRSQVSRPWLPPHCRAALLKRRHQQQQQQDQQHLLAPLGETRHLHPYQALHLLDVCNKIEQENNRSKDSKERTGNSKASNVVSSSTDEPTGVCIKKIADNQRILLCSLLASHARQLQLAQMLPSITAIITSGTAADDSSTKGLDPLTSEQFLNVPSPSTDSLVTPLSPLSPMSNLSPVSPAEAEGPEVSKEKKREEGVKDLQASLEKLELQKQERLQLVQHQKEQLEKLSSELQLSRDAEYQLQEELVSLQRTLELLPSLQENRARLEAVITSSDTKMSKLKHQFTAHCTPLQHSIEELGRQIHAQQGEHEVLSAEVQSLRQKRQGVLQEAPTIHAQTQLLTEKLQTRGQAVARSVYTKRILEMTAAVHQQRQVTESVLLEVRKLQKEINSIAGKIDRSFTVIEEVSYKASWSNNSSTGLYRRVISLHDSCSSIVNVIRETGATKRQVAELKEQVMLEGRRETAKALAKLQEDLAAVKQENTAIKARKS
uniref:Coiled-coil domain-containing protein 22 homolog n=2 Tax=Hirondellea gigas TaxID=1518452 RepID=A0A6A7G438_9CRUS